MVEMIKKNLLNISIVFVYTLLACLVYGIWSYSAWELWYVTLIIVIIFAGAGCTLGYFWLKSEIKKKNESIKSNEVKEDLKESNSVETE
ncbi:MAG: hypothetical protein K2I42_00730 [Anaeroplasmataceae bacterium]|nr:hypothetical protein [Anaeroplasmataceae bacterium]